MGGDSSSSASIVDFPGTRKTLSDAAAAWLRNERKIDPKISDKLPVGSATLFFPQLNRKSEAIIFYFPDGWKAHAFPEKSFTSKKGTTRTFWNLDAVLARKELGAVYIVEGELDACSLAECGIPSDAILAAPGTTGASDPLEYVQDALKEGLNKARRFIWCGDQDKAGLELRSAMVQILGTARFHFVEWPEGCKDANDCLRFEGAENLRDRIDNGFKEWPSTGLFKLSQIPDSAPLTQWETGFEDWNGRLYLAPGTLSLVTGHPGMGKTMLWTQIWQQVVAKHNLVACIASFETRPKPQMRRQLRCLHGRCVERVMLEDYPEKIRAADKWIDEHYLFLIHPERRPDLRWLLSEAETAVIRDGAKIVQIDPWNRLEASREKSETETDYIGRCLREIYNFAIDLNCHVQILAHPSKTDSARRGEPPELEDTAGSKNWDNMVDQGFVVHRPQLFDDEGARQFYAELYHKKARFDELGYATKFGIEFDPGMGRYGTCKLQQKGKKKNKNAAEPVDASKNQ